MALQMQSTGGHPIDTVHSMSTASYSMRCFSPSARAKDKQGGFRGANTWEVCAPQVPDTLSLRRSVLSDKTSRKIQSHRNNKQPPMKFGNLGAVLAALVAALYGGASC
jgi:hypothetical protein